MLIDTDVLVMGAGLSGVGFAIRLQQKYPRATFEIYEKAEALGGTWWANTYPGCACDVRSVFFIFPIGRPNWTGINVMECVLGSIASLFLLFRSESRMERAVCASG